MADVRARDMIHRVLIPVVLACALATSGCVTSATTRVKRHFGVRSWTRQHTAVSHEVRQAILKACPVGSSWPEVRAYLKGCRIGKDKYSGLIFELRWRNPGGGIACYVRRGPSLSTDNYEVDFVFGPTGRLRDVIIFHDNYL